MSGIVCYGGLRNHAVPIQENGKEVGAIESEHITAVGEPPGGTETILLVDDEKAIRFILGLCLKGFGYTVLAPESPGAALRLVGEQGGGIDLLLTDVVMPGMCGRELAEKLMPNFPAMKVLYMSGYTADFITRQGILDENVHFLGKPATLDVLARKVRGVLDDLQHLSRAFDEPLLGGEIETRHPQGVFLHLGRREAPSLGGGEHNQSERGNPAQHHKEDEAKT